MKDPATWVRPHIERLEPYRAARDLYGPGERVFLDANESPYELGEFAPPAGLNRYPDPRCTELRGALARRLGVEPSRLWLGNGSDEALDLLLRAFVDPGEPVVICTPTYAMYDIGARAHAARVRPAPLDEAFDLDVEATLATAAGSRLIFLCSPNNPTGNRLSRDRIERLLRDFDGLVVLDEAYVEYSTTASLAPLTAEHRNLAVLRTFSKAWGLAAARVGYMVADPMVIEYIERINLPYPLSTLSATAARQALERAPELEERVRQTRRERQRLARRLRELGCRVFPSDANFLLVRVPEASLVQRRLADEFGVVVRDRSRLPRLENCLRVTVGRPDENARLCTALEAILA